MKRILVITVLVISTFVAYSQVLVEETKVWNNVECINFGGCWTYSYKIMGDTTINQIDYKKIYGISDTIKTNRGAFGAMREHEKQVFFYNLEHETEEVLYDFNLTVGETFITTINSPEYFGCQVQFEVYSIDSITIFNGDKRKRILMSSGEQWVEGIGSLNGILRIGVYQCGADMYYDLSCCHLNGEKIFQSTFFDNCYIYTVGYEENTEQIKPVVYPNPFSESTKFIFDYSSSSVYRLQILDGMGQIIRDIEDIKSGEIIISGNHFNSGIHFYRLTTDSKVIASGKLIKKE